MLLRNGRRNTRILTGQKYISSLRQRGVKEAFQSTVEEVVRDKRSGGVQKLVKEEEEEVLLQYSNMKIRLYKIYKYSQLQQQLSPPETTTHIPFAHIQYLVIQGDGEISCILTEFVFNQLIQFVNACIWLFQLFILLYKLVT
ncbi:Hypothetical_protein [Hexamita inflata]|uniref:Hypothetical_protein n=1 Tax=Hexamita inflata TaxID=28002 RepID=A0AA86R219_9EUKA|nr:Hypothetical protein HINF_LOCUS53186 [Hexamita inflata]